MTSALLVATADAPPLESDLEAAGVKVAGRSDASALVRDVARSGTDLVVCWEPYPRAGLLHALDALQQHAPVPVLLFTSDSEHQTMTEALASGVHAYVVNGYDARRLRPLVQIARARFERDQAQRAEHSALQGRFEERTLVERAKGILMRSRQVPEAQAFRMLRDASMQAQQRVGAVSRRVIDAARDAEAVNRAGQLRMLSQRIVKLYALQCVGVDAEVTQRSLKVSMQQVDDNLRRLTGELSAATFGDLLAAVDVAWQTMRPALSGAPTTTRLAALDLHAERLLIAADRLTSALEAASTVTTLDIVNRAGRQRMLSQRLAKQALIATLLEGDAAHSAAADAVRTIESFEAALRHLNQAPLGSSLIRADLDLAQQHWQLMLEGVRAVDDNAGRTAIAGESESLLDLFERITEHYGQAAQQLLDPR